jgi:polar amino acid transport system substrate-binding protein
VGSHEPATQKETTYERVMRTGTLRCAWWSVPPLSYKDMKTGEMKGFTVDLIDEIAQKLSLKVKWVEEVNFATMMAGLEANRYDSICTGVWLSADRARVMDYTSPYLFSSVIAIVRNDDHRFDDNFQAINNEFVRIAVQDTLVISLASEMFPKAKRIELSEQISSDHAYLEIESDKADVALSDAADFQHYAEKNPGKLRMVHTNHPLRLYPWVLPVRAGEHQLAATLNGALTEMIYNGEIESIVKRNGIPANTYAYIQPDAVLK